MFFFIPISNQGLFIRRLLLLALFLCCNAGFAQVDSLKFNKSLELFHKYKFANVDSAKYYLDRLDVLSQEDLKSPLRYRYYVVSGGWNMVKREISPAIVYYKKAIELANELNNNEFIVRSKFNLGAAYGETGDYDKAIPLFKEVEAGLNQVKTDPNLFANQFRSNMMHFYLKNKDIPAALKYSDQIKKNLKNYNDTTMYYMSRLNLLSSTIKHKEVIQLGEEALKMFKKNDLHFRYQTFAFLGTSYLALSDYDNARKNLYQALDLSKKLGIESGLVENSLGQLNMKEKDYKNASIQFNKSLELAKKQGIPTSESIAVKHLAELHEAQGNSREALKYLNQYIILNDSLMDLEKIKAIQDAEARYELKDKEKAIQQQVEVNSLQKALLDEEHQRQLVLIGFLVCSVLFALALGFFYRKSSRANKQLIFQRNQIEEYATDLKRANQMRDKLFAMISHDLRSPVSSLVSSLQEFESVKPMASLTYSLNNVQHILNNLLKWAQLQLTTKPLRPKAVHLDHLLRCLIHQFTPVLSQKGIQVINDFKHSSLVWVDEESLQIVLRNIISNAVKFTGESGLIRITTTEDKEFVSLIVRDSGIGLSPGQIEQLFIYPESRTGTSGETGTGLGMTLTKDLIDKMNGSIAVKSKVDVGTSILIKLPVEAMS